MAFKDGLQTAEDIAPPGNGPARRFAWARYLTVLLGVPATLIAAILVTARHSSSNSLIEGTAGYIADYRYVMRNIDADLLIYGDSSASRNLDPLVIGGDLHMKVANIGGDAQSFRVLRTSPIDVYLQHNKAPKVIVLAAAPWNLPPEQISPDNSFDGVLMIVRHYAFGSLAKFAVQNPGILLNFTFQVAQNMIRPGSWWHFNRDHELDKRIRQEMEEHVGFVPQGFDSADPNAQAALAPKCKLDMGRVDPLIEGSLATEFVRKFSSPQTTAVVYLPALPDCSGYQAQTAIVPEKQWLIPPSVVPHDFMVNDASMIHGRMEYTAALSHLASAAIANKLKETKFEPAQLEQPERSGLFSELTR